MRDRQYFLLFGALACVPALPLLWLWVDFDSANSSSLFGIWFYSSIGFGVPALVLGSVAALILGVARLFGFALRPVIASAIVLMVGPAFAYLAWASDPMMMFTYVLAASVVAWLVYRKYPPTGMRGSASDERPKH